MDEHNQVLTGSVLGIVFSVLFLWWGFATVDHPVGLDPSNSIVYALRWDLILAGWVLLLVTTVSLQRFSTVKYLDGTPPPDGHSIDINRRVLRNTLEQAFLATIGHLVLSTSLPSSYLGIIPVLVVLFCLGRICFWIGYHLVESYPWVKAFGHATTFFPTFGVYGYLLYRMTGMTVS